MNVKLSFDSAAAERLGCTVEQMRQTVKDLFSAHDLPCVSEGDVLVFADKGHGDDFACMWEIILALLRSRWFLDCASTFLGGRGRRGGSAGPNWEGGGGRFSLI